VVAPELSKFSLGGIWILFTAADSILLILLSVKIYGLAAGAGNSGRQGVPAQLAAWRIQDRARSRTRKGVCCVCWSSSSGRVVRCCSPGEWLQKCGTSGYGVDPGTCSGCFQVVLQVAELSPDDATFLTCVAFIPRRLGFLFHLLSVQPTRLPPACRLVHRPCPDCFSRGLKCILKGWSRACSLH
jgi:hypothetical protein